MPTLLHSSAPVTLIGAGALAPGDLLAARQHAPVVVAADGGADAALAHGVVPALVIGDGDSLSAMARARIPASRIHDVADPDTTDFQKCLARIVAPRLLCVGFLGGRIDHALAVLSALAASPRDCVLFNARDVVFHAPARCTLDLPPGTRLSLFPMAPVTGRSTGLAWPIDGLALSPGGRIGTSNRTTGPVTLHLDGPGMLVIVPRRGLAAVLARG